MNNLENYYAFIRNQTKQQTQNKPLNLKIKINQNTCKFCQTKGKLVPSDDDMVCQNCGRLQGGKIMQNQSPTQGDRQNNGKVLFARVVVEENQKIKLLTNRFFNTLFPLRNETAAGYEVAAIYQEIKKYKARYISKTDIQSAFKGLHMPTIVLCIIYCKLVQENRAIPLSILAVLMNKTIEKSRSKVTPVVLKHIQYYRINQKIGISKFFKLRKTKCYNTPLLPSAFIEFTSNIYGVKDRVVKRLISIIADEIFQEYSEMTPPGVIATGTMFFVFGMTYDLKAKDFGKTQKELTDISNKIKQSKNPKIQVAINDLTKML